MYQNDSLAYSTTYSSSYTSPTKTQAHSTFYENHQNDTSGFTSNNHFSPLELAPLDGFDRFTTVSHSSHSDKSSVRSILTSPKTIPRSVVEHSGFWHEPAPNILYDSPARRVQSTEEAERNAKHLDAQTLRRISHHNAIDGENGGVGPRWGSTTASTAYGRLETPHERYERIDKSLIGSREATGFTRQHLTVPEQNVAPMTSVNNETYVRHQQTRPPEIPNRTVMQRSGFADSTVPTMNKKMNLYDVGPERLTPIEIQRLKYSNTPEYQNLYNPDPYTTSSEVSYKPPQNTISRSVETGTNIMRASTGYSTNETVIAGSPGDPRYYKTGKTEMAKKFIDPSTLKTRDIQATPNVVERSGYWAT